VSSTLKQFCAGIIFTLTSYVISLNFSSGIMLGSLGKSERDVRLIMSQGLTSAQLFSGYEKSLLPTNYSVDLPVRLHWNVQRLRSNLVSFPNEDGDNSGFFTMYRDIARFKAANQEWDAGLGRTDEWILWPYMPYVLMPTWFFSFILYFVLAYIIKRLRRPVINLFRNGTFHDRARRGFDPLASSDAGCH
jgi:hypothetical protein